MEVVAGRPLFPDPILTASLYHDRHLDHLLHGVVAPFWRKLGAHHALDSCYLWTFRYARRGEHLKIRLHGPDDLRQPMKRLLTEAAERYFAPLGAPDEDAPRIISKKSPPIDLEDEEEGAHPDRTLLWTKYKRNHVALVGEPFLLDDRYVALSTRCLAAGCRRVLEALQPDGSGDFPSGSRPGTLLKLLVEGLAGLDLSAEERSGYLEYHRDWLIRFSLLKRSVEPEKALEVLEMFDRRLVSMGPRMQAIRELLEEQREAGGNPAEPVLRHELAELFRHTRCLCESQDYHIDRFASDPAFVCVFKALHGISNQLGLSILDEAFVHHLLLAASLPSDVEFR